MDSSNADRRVARLSDTENEIQQLKERISTLEAELAQMSVRNGLEKVKEQFAKKKASHESAVAVSKMVSSNGNSAPSYRILTAFQDD
jgi:predicted  nucleic acid-binding Zn-ribbon protein